MAGDRRGTSPNYGETPWSGSDGKLTKSIRTDLCLWSLFPEGCQYRLRIVQALGQNRTFPYRVVYSSSNMAGNHAAIQAGLGVTALSKHTIPPYLQEIPENQTPACAR